MVVALSTFMHFYDKDHIKPQVNDIEALIHRRSIHCTEREACFLLSDSRQRLSKKQLAVVQLTCHARELQPSLPSLGVIIPPSVLTRL